MNKETVISVIASILILGHSTQAVYAETELFGIANQLLGQVTPDTPSILYSIDINTGVGTILGPIGFNKCDAMDIDNSGTLYATCHRPLDRQGVLITIDPRSGVGTEIGLTGIGLSGGFGENSPKGISFRNSDGILFGYSHRCRANFGLMTIDIDTGQATTIPSGRCRGGNGIAFSFDDILYHDDDTSFNIIDPANGAFTVVGAGKRITAMDFNPDDELLYAANTLGRGARELVTVDITTGGLTTIGRTVDRLTALAFFRSLTGDQSVGPGETLIIRNETVTGNVFVDGGTLILTQSSTVNGNIVGSSGAFIVIEGVRNVHGNIEIVISGPGSTLEIIDSNVSGSIETNNIDTLTIINSNLNGNILSDGDVTVTITDNTINGNVEIFNPTSCIELLNTVNGNNFGCP